MKKFLAVLALVLVTISTHAQTNESAAKARRIFDEMRAKYSRLETFSHGKILFSYNGKDDVSDVKFAFRQPNRYSRIVHRPEGDWVDISNGRTNYFYDGKQSKKNYFATLMPPEKLGRVSLMQTNVGGFFLAPLLAGVDPFTAPWGEAAIGFSLGKPTQINGVMTNAVVVRIAGKEKAIRTYFIGQKDHLVYRATQSGTEFGKDYSFSETYLDIRANPKIPIATFAFIPPPGTRQAKLEELSYEREMVSKDVRVGEFPPPLVGVDLKGNPIDITNYKGKVVLLDFWATWCGPCIVDLPFVQAAYEKFHDQDFEIIGISYDQKRDDLENFISERNMTWPQIFAAEQKQKKNDSDKRYNVRGIPFTLLIGRDGKIAAFNPTRLLLEPAIEKALAAPMPE